jgi:PadR family transcriptional regulator PadR
MAKQKKKPDLPDPMALTQTEEIVLSALTFRDRYGLEIIEAVKETSGGARTIGFSSLYPTLKKLEAKGYVESRWGDEEPEEITGARRRYYRITGAGARALDLKRSFLTNLSSFGAMGGVG